MKIAEELLELDPGNAEYRRDLWPLLWRIGHSYEKVNRKKEAKAQFAKVIDQLREMKEREILVPGDEKWIVEAEARMAALEE